MHTDRWTDTQTYTHATHTHTRSLTQTHTLHTYTRSLTHTNTYTHSTPPPPHTHTHTLPPPIHPFPSPIIGATRLPAWVALTLTLTLTVRAQVLCCRFASGSALWFPQFCMITELELEAELEGSLVTSCLLREASMLFAWWCDSRKAPVKLKANQTKENKSMHYTHSAYITYNN